MREAELHKIDTYVRNLELLVKELDEFSGYLKLSEETEELQREAINILKKKCKKMRKAKNIKELKKVMRVKKFLGGDDDED